MKNKQRITLGTGSHVLMKRETALLPERETKETAKSAGMVSLDTRPLFESFLRSGHTSRPRSGPLCADANSPTLVS